MVSSLARGIFYPFSTQRLSRWLSTIGRMPTHTTDAAAKFLKSPNGIYSALYMTIDEMAMIKKDTWNHNIWGIPPDDYSERATTLPTAVPLCFYFGAQDIWVCNEARDRLMALRGRLLDGAKELWKPLMIIDNNNIPHGFIVDHNQIIAEKTFDLINLLIRESGSDSSEPSPSSS